MLESFLAYEERIDGKSAVEQNLESLVQVVCFGEVLADYLHGNLACFLELLQGKQYLGVQNPHLVIAGVLYAREYLKCPACLALAQQQLDFHLRILLRRGVEHSRYCKDLLGAVAPVHEKVI